MRKRRPPVEDRPTEDQPAWKRRLYCIIFESKTTGGKAFDISLLVAIGLSVTVVMLESVKSIQADYAILLRVLEWVLPGFSRSNISRACSACGGPGDTP